MHRLPTSLLFRQRTLRAADKPAGWLSVPSRQGADDKRPCLGRRLEDQLGCAFGRCTGSYRGDRLDLFAKNEDAHRQANGWFERRDVEKVYEALTEGKAPADAARDVTWRSMILRGKKHAYESPHGKAAETGARLIGEVAVEGGPALRWQLEPRTGRPHQLRYELAKHAYPILGDALYGSKRPFVDGIALRCVRLGFLGCCGARELGLPEALVVAALASGAAEESA